MPRTHEAVLMIGTMLMLGCAVQPTQTASAPGSQTNDPGSIRYVALGDSYTIGTGVPSSERWTNQLIERLADAQPSLKLVANLATNGYTSGDVISEQLPALPGLEPGFVSLLIGVNDVVRGRPAAEYEANVARILDALLDELPSNRIIVVSTPDYTRTPRGADYGDRARQRAAIAQFNGIIAAAARARDIAFVDIGPVADQADREPALVAGDGLHPSGAQYERWVDLIEPVVTSLLARE